MIPPGVSELDVGKKTLLGYQDSLLDIAARISRFDLPSLIGSTKYTIRHKILVIFHDIFDDLSRTFIWIVHNLDLLKDYNILIFNYPGQPMTVFNDTTESNNLELTLLVDQ